MIIAFYHYSARSSGRCILIVHASTLFGNGAELSANGYLTSTRNGDIECIRCRSKIVQAKYACSIAIPLAVNGETVIRKVKFGLSFRIQALVPFLIRKLNGLSECAKDLQETGFSFSKRFFRRQRKDQDIVEKLDEQMVAPK